LQEIEKILRVEKENRETFSETDRGTQIDRFNQEIDCGTEVDHFNQETDTAEQKLPTFQSPVLPHEKIVLRKILSAKQLIPT
jgi:hypothetical protein